MNDFSLATAQGRHDLAECQVCSQHMTRGYVLDREIAGTVYEDVCDNCFNTIEDEARLP